MLTADKRTALLKFEPGCIQCSECGYKPEDPWDDAPEGFNWTSLLGWLCKDCEDRLTQQISRG